MSMHTPEPRNDAQSALCGLLAVLNEDKDGGYFICAEAEQTIENARAVAAEVDATPEAAPQLIEHYGRVFRVLATYPETEQAEANALMEANETAALLCIRDGTAYLADVSDHGQELIREPLRTAAPTLLHALRMAAGFIESGESAGHTFFEVREAWRNAIAAAEGSSP
jgi:hypothetical protein